MQRALLRGVMNLVLILVVVCSFLACGGRSGGRTTEKYIEVGVIAPLTGSVPVWGQNTVRGIQLAAKEINATGGISGKELRLLIEDSKCEPQEAVRILRKFITSQDVRVVLGNVCSSNVLAMAPIAERNKVVLFSTGASNPKISDAGDYVFRNWPSDAIQGKLTAEYAATAVNLQNAAIFYVNNAYGQGLESVFREEFEKLGGAVVLSETYAEGATDFRAQLSRIKDSAPQGLYLPAYTQEYPLILRQAEEIGFSGPIIASETFDDPRTIADGGSAAEGVVFPSPAAFDTQNELGHKFYEAFKTEYGEEPGITADTAYDALRIVAAAFESGASSGPEVRDYLLNLKDFPGVAGATTFDEKGDAPKEIMFYQVREGKAVPLDAQQSVE